MEITRKHVYKGIGITVTVYVVGIFANLFFGNVNLDSDNAKSYLEERKETLTRNIREYNQNISIAREPFLSQYKDSLENAIKDTTFLRGEIKIAEKENIRTLREMLSSWYGFFID